MAQYKPKILLATAVIFDVDGTLVDTVDLHADAWRRAFAAFGFEYEFSRIRSQIGKGGDQLLPVFLNHDELEAEGKNIEFVPARAVQTRICLARPRLPGRPRVVRRSDRRRKKDRVGLVGQS